MSSYTDKLIDDILSQMRKGHTPISTPVSKIPQQQKAESLDDKLSRAKKILKEARAARAANQAAETTSTAEETGTTPTGAHTSGAPVAVDVDKNTDVFNVPSQLDTKLDVEGANARKVIADPDNMDSKDLRTLKNKFRNEVKAEKAKPANEQNKEKINLYNAYISAADRSGLETSGMLGHGKTTSLNSIEEKAGKIYQPSIYANRHINDTEHMNKDDLKVLKERYRERLGREQRKPKRLQNENTINYLKSAIEETDKQSGKRGEVSVALSELTANADKRASKKNQYVANTSPAEFKSLPENYDAKSAKPASVAEWAGKNAIAGVSQINKTIFSTLDFIMPTDFLGKYDFFHNLNKYYGGLNESYAAEAQRASTSRGKGWKTAGDLISGTVAALPNSILAILTAGASIGLSSGTLAADTISSTVPQLIGNTIKTMAKNPLYWSSFLQTLGTDYEEAKERGANDLTATFSAFITSGLNAGIEVGGGIEQLPNKLKSGGKTAVLDWVKSSLEEGQEEILQGITTNIVAKAMYDHSAPLVSLNDDNAVINPKKSGQDFVMGAAVGAILGGGQTAIAKGINAAQISRTGKFFNNTPEAVSGLVDTGLESPKDTLSYKLAEKASKKSGKLSNYEVGQLYNANVEQIAAEESEAQRITGETVENTPSATTPEAYSAVNDTSINTQSVTPIADEGITTSTQYEPVKVNDTFRDTKTGNTLRIKERTAKNVTVEVDNGAKTELRTYPASFVDKQFNTNSRYAAMSETENAVTEDVAHNDSLSKSAEINKLNAKSADNSPKTPDINNKTVLSVVEDTVFPQLKEDAIDLFEKEYGGKGLSGFADRLVENYKKTGDIGDNERNLFSDGGEAIKSFIAEKVKNERATDTENISDRVFETVGARNVKAFQYTYPQFKKYYLPLAQELLSDIDSTVKGEKFVIYDSQNGNGNGIAEFSGTNRITSEAIARIKDSTKASYADIKDALNRIINDSGRENTALAKRIELVMDDMLTDGYTAFDGTKIPPNESYIAEKADVENSNTKADNANVAEVSANSSENSVQSNVENKADTEKKASSKPEDGADNGGRQKRQLKDMSPQLQDMFRKRQEAAESVPTSETATKATYSAEELKTSIKEQLANGVNTLDEITRNTGARVNDVNTALFEMSLNGDVTQKPGNVYELNSSASDTKEAGKSETTENKSLTPTSYDTAQNAIQALSKGEDVSLTDIKDAVNSLCNSEAEIKTELSKLKNTELKLKMNIMDRGRYSKKADMVNAIYDDMLSNAYYTISGKNTMTIMFDGRSHIVQTKELLLSELGTLTGERLNTLKTKYAEEYNKRIAEREQRKKSLEKPQTLDDYLRKKRTVGLSEQENEDFERLYAEKRKSNRKEKVSQAKDTTAVNDFLANADNYTIEKTVHTKTGDEIWVIRPVNRLETSEWKKLNEQMKALGGSYWRGNQGWNFKKDPTAQLSSETEGAKGDTNVEKLRNIADNMQKIIDDKFRDRRTNTAKRASEAARAEAEGEKLKTIQDTIRNLAVGIENGTVKLLTDIDSRVQVDTLFRLLNIAQNERIKNIEGVTYSQRLEEQAKPFSNEDIKYAKLPLDIIYIDFIKEYARAAEGKDGYKMIHSRLEKAVSGAKGNYIRITPQLFADINKVVKNLDTLRADFWEDGISQLNRLKRMGIEDNAELRAYLREFVQNIPDADAEAKKNSAIKKKERELANSKIAGFFPTPKNIVDKMLEEADIKPGEKILEPSAGKGNIADEIKANYPDNNLDVAEWNASLNEFLSEKGHNVIGNDFLKVSDKYDKIVMNPPFENGQDIEHIKHAYLLLNDGGRIVCIMSEGPFYRSDKKATEFREWLNDVNGVSEKLPENSFKNSERSTGVNTRLVVIDKGSANDVMAESKATANTDKVVSAIQTTIKPEILSDEKLTSMLKKQFGDNGIYGLADKIISVNMENQSIKGFEHLFTDGGKAVREALKGTDKRKEKYALSTAPASNIYDYTKTFSDQLDDWKNGKIPPYDSLLVGATPDVLKRIGFNALPITINQKHIDYAINGNKDSDHAIGISVLRQLPKALENPVAVIESQSQPNRVVVIVDMKHNGKSVVMPIEVDGYGTQNSLLIDSNAIVSIYAKDNAVTKQLNGAIQNEQSGNTAVFYLNKNKAAALLQIAGLQLPGHLFRNNGYIHSILENSSNVKPKFKNVTYSQQFKRWFGDWESKKNTASKVVNKDGTPKIVYHGTSRGGFTVFDTYGSNYGLFGTGSYFTEDAEIAEQYTNKGKGQNKTVYSAYLNIRKPIDMDAAADIGLWSKAVNKYSDEIYVDFSNCKTNEDCFRAVEDAMEYEGFPKYEAYEFMREILQNDMGFDGITHIGGGRIQKDSKKHRVWIAFNPEQIKSATDNIGTFDPNKADIRYSTGKGGYSGHSMSNRAVRAYENGERPLSKWTKSELLNNIEDVCFDNDVTPPDFSKLTVSELRDNFLVRSSWHHTGALYNATNFYELDSDAVLKASPETIEDIISNRQRNILSEAERDEKKRGQIALQQAQETYRKIAFIFDAGISKYKRLSSLVEQYTKGKLDVESEYNKALDKRIEETSRKVEAWEKLPEGHWRKKSVSEFNDNAIEYVEKVYSRTDSNNGDIQKLKKNILSKNVNIENKDGEYSPKKNEERGRFAYEQSRDDLLFGNGGREYNASAGEQAEKISGFKREIEGKAEAERRSYAKELVEKGFTEKVTNGIHQYNLIKPEAYNDDMKSIAEAAEKRGVKVGFFAGHAIRSFDGQRAFLIDGIKISDTAMLLSSDGTQSPQMLSKHEEIHIDWNTPEIQKAKEIILNGLSEAEKQSLLSDGRYKEYFELYEGDTDAVWEEFVADVFSGMNTYTADYADIVADYWYDGKVIDRYSPAEYNNITDAGGVNNSGNEYSLLNKGKSNRVAVPNKWRPDLSVKKLIALQNDIKNEIKSSKQYVTDGAKWIFTDIDGTDVFAIYSTEDFSEPTILYESKDKRAEIEKTYLLNLLEAVENESVDGKSRIIGEIFGGNWVRLRDSIRDSDKTVGRGSSYRDAGVLPRQSPRKPRKAFENVIRNLLEIQRENRRTSGVVNDKDQGRYFLSTDNGNDEFWAEFLNETKKYSDLISEYGAIEKGENPVRDIDVPKRTSAAEYVSRFARTAIESGVVPDESIDEFKAAILSGAMSHEVITDKSAAKKAENTIKSNGFENALNQWYGAVNSGHMLNKNDIALGQQLFNQCIQNKDVKNAMKLVADLSAEATRAGQAVQASRMLKKLTPDGQLYYLERSIEKIKANLEKKGLIQDGKTARTSNSLFNKLERIADKKKAVEGKEQLTKEWRKQIVSYFKNGDISAVEDAIYKLDTSRLTLNDRAFIVRATKLYKSDILKYDSIKKKEISEMSIDERLVKKFLEAKTKEERDTVYDEICLNIAEQIPASAADKWNAWRYLSMLGNAKTHIRNIVGNAVFYPAVRLKSFTAAAIERAVLPEAERTTSVLKTKASKQFAAKDFELVQNELQGTGGKYVTTSNIEDKRQIFKTKWLETLRKKNGEFLEAEDMLFLKAHYIDAFARLMTARKLTEADFDITTEKGQENLSKARSIAFREAQEATYRDFNAVSAAITYAQKNALNSESRALRAVGYAIEGILPFKKTPLNIAKRGIEYSPIGLIDGLRSSFFDVKKGKCTANEAINKVAKGLTGTALTILGYTLAALGIISGAEDDNDKKKSFDALIGKQAYALNIGGKSYTIDWMAPVCMPLFIGVEFLRCTQDKDYNFAKAVNALSKISEPLLELSCLSGISDTVQSAQFNKTNALQAVAEEIATSYISQALPTFGGQITRIIDKKKRNGYYQYSESHLPSIVHTLIGNVSSKIPLVGKLFIEPKIDAWGRDEEYGNLPERVFENIISPGYYSKEEYTQVDKEIEAIYEKTGEEGVLPSKIQKSLTIDKKNYSLNSHQYTQYARLKGQKRFELVKELIEKGKKTKKKFGGGYVRTPYNSLSDEEKVKAIKKCYDDASDYANSEMKKVLDK